MSGPIGIGQMSGEFWREGFVPLVHFIALLSISLGLINLFPIPVLDGGHLAVLCNRGHSKGRPAGDRALALGFRVGFALIVSFFVFVMWHDLASTLCMSLQEPKNPKVAKDDEIRVACTAAPDGCALLLCFYRSGFLLFIPICRSLLSNTRAL